MGTDGSGGKRSSLYKRRLCAPVVNHLPGSAASAVAALVLAARQRMGRRRRAAAAAAAAGASRHASAIGGYSSKINAMARDREQCDTAWLSVWPRRF